MAAEALIPWEALRPPARMRLSEWADKHFVLSAESAAEPGRWRTLPYQRGIMDAITDPDTWRVTWIKAARVGATKIMVAAIGYFIDQDPCPILIVQPTVEDAKGFSKEEIAPMLRDCPVLAGKVIESSSRRLSEQTLLHKTFAGGVLSMIGANSGRGFRRVSRRAVFFDEVDGYPPSAGDDGDQIALGIKRTEYYWNRKVFAGSTPGIKGASRIETIYLEGDQRRYHVPCLQCSHYDYLVFREGKRGHVFRWPEGKPAKAYFECSKNGCVIEEKSKREMLEEGKWIADAPFDGHASFHLWAAYSVAPNATWRHIATEWQQSEKRPELRRVVTNTLLGESYEEVGEAPDWEHLQRQSESYAPGTVPDEVEFLTAGVDVQKDRFVYSIDGWNWNRESWSIEIGVLMGDTADEATWGALDELLDRRFVGADKREFPITMMAVDCGYNTQQVYHWARQKERTRVIACKGFAKLKLLLGVPMAVDVTWGGKRIQRGYRYWPVGVDLAKAEFYGWLRLTRNADGSYPAGYYHYPEHPEEWYRQITGEHLVPELSRKGVVTYVWKQKPNRENHWLDTRILNRAAATVLGLDRHVSDEARRAKRQARAKETPRENAAAEDVTTAPVAPEPEPAPAKKSWILGRNARHPRAPGSGWFDRRRRRDR